ncbi:hypothetical protein KKA00_01890 [bacterium]|nr:hypothetical protein [bacterium]MBU1650943.1 hypothetical protein [bacterium]
MRLLLLNGFMLLLVPASMQAGIHTTIPTPFRFGLGNIASVPEYRLSGAQFETDWLLSTGGARLFGMVELQPYALQISGPILAGRAGLQQQGINVAAYHEMSSQLSYQRTFWQNLRLGVGSQLYHVKINGYGSTWSSSFDIRGDYQLREGLYLNAAWINIGKADFGENGYPLPVRYIFGLDYVVLDALKLYFEIDKDTRYALQTRIAANADIWGPVGILVGYQSTPDIAAMGLNVSYHKIAFTAAYQYHPDLGVSQCYGLSFIF